MHRKSVFLNKALISFLSVLMLTATAAFRVSFVEAHPMTTTVSPTEAPVGDTVTVTGLNLTPYGEVRLYMSRSLFLTETTANATGGFSTNFTVPAIPSQRYIIVAMDISSGDSAGAFFTVEPRILLTPARGSFNDKIFVKGEGFAPNSNTTLEVNGMIVTPFSASLTDYSGSFEASFYVPSTPRGECSVDVYDPFGDTASAMFNVVPKITTWPTSGGSSSVVLVNGYGFAPSANATIYFGSVDVTPFPSYATSTDGSFHASFLLPTVPDGKYLINVSDTAGNVASAPFIVPSSILTLTPDRISEPSIVNVRGEGFQPYAPVVLYLEDVTMTNIVDLVWASENLIPYENGTFEYAFIVPVTESGIFSVSAFQALGPLPSDLRKVASDILTIFEEGAVDVQVSVGSLHFRGEMAEFYLKTSFDGKLVDVYVEKASLYYLNGSSNMDLSEEIGQIATGFYRIPYAVPGTASFGTYVLLVEVSYETRLIQAFGTSSGVFLLSPALTGQSAQLIDIENSIGTVIIPDIGTIRANLSAINAKLVSIEGETATIESDIGTLKTSLDAIHAKVTQIIGSTVTISSDVGTIKSQVIPSWSSKDMVTLILSLVAAVGATISAILITKKRTPTPTASTSPPGSPEPTEPALSEPAQSSTQAESSANTTKPEEAPPLETPSEETPSTEPPPRDEPPPTESPQSTEPEPLTPTPTTSPPEPSEPEPTSQVEAPPQ